MHVSLLQLKGHQRDKGGFVPLVHVQVARHIGGQAGGGGRASHGLQSEVVSPTLLHAEVAEVEALGTQAVCSSKQRLRLRQVAAVTPGAGNRRRVHGCEGRRHLHGGGLVVGVAIVVPGNGRSERLHVVTEVMSDGKRQ
jgi:hypothetical protein